MLLLLRFSFLFCAFSMFFCLCFFLYAFLCHFCFYFIFSSMFFFLCISSTFSSMLFFYVSLCHFSFYFLLFSVYFYAFCLCFLLFLSALLFNFISFHFSSVSFRFSLIFHLFSLISFPVFSFRFSGSCLFSLPCLFLFFPFILKREVVAVTVVVISVFPDHFFPSVHSPVGQLRENTNQTLQRRKCSSIHFWQLSGYKKPAASFVLLHLYSFLS